MARGREREIMEHDPEALAASAFRVFATVTGGKAVWEHLSERDQDRWARVGRHAETLLSGLEGRSYSQAGFQVMVLHAEREDRGASQRTWDSLPPLAKLAWEAVARHLTMLFNCDEITTLGEAEAQWPAWARERAGRGSPRR